MSVTDRILSALTTVIRMNDKVEEMAGLMKEQQRRLDDLQGLPAGCWKRMAIQAIPDHDLRHTTSGVSNPEMSTHVVGASPIGVALALIRPFFTMVCRCDLTAEHTSKAFLPYAELVVAVSP